MPAVIAELRADAPYLACAADEADRSFASAATIAAIQASAEARCEALLEQNVETSLVTIGAAGSRDADNARAQIRAGLRQSLLVLVERRVAAQRQGSTSSNN